MSINNIYDFLTPDNELSYEVTLVPISKTVLYANKTLSMCFFVSMAVVESKPGAAALLYTALDV